MARYTEQELNLQTLNGENDQDRGGRQPEIRAELRDQIRVMVGLANQLETTDIYCLTQEDLLIAARLANRIGSATTQYSLTRERQSYSIEKRGRLSR